MLTPTHKAEVRKAISAYCLKAEQYRMNRGYSQRRPVLSYGLPADHIQIDDCSGFVSKAVWWANAHTPNGTHVNLPGFKAGIGNTESMQAYLTHEAAGKIQVGDIALWSASGNDWNTSHTAICRTAGTLKTAIFTSHGHQSWRFSNDAPEPLHLQYFPEHLIGVYRMPELR